MRSLRNSTVKGFVIKSTTPRLFAFSINIFFFAGRDKHDRYVFAKFSETLEEFHAIHVRQILLGDDQIKVIKLQLLQGAGGVIGAFD